MDDRPAPSRRKFLAGTAGASGALVAGCANVNGVLPDRLVRARARRRPVPEVPPAVETTDAHVRTMAAEIAGYATDAREEWERVDDSESRQPYYEHELERAAEFADSMSSEPPVVDTVESAGYHLARATGGYAYARASNGEFERDPAADAATWLEETESIAAQFAYETADPETFLAYGRQIEYSLNKAEMVLSRRADDNLESWDQPDHAEEIAESYSSVQRGRLRTLDASAYREALRERDTGTESIAETLAESQTVLGDRVGDLLDDRVQWLDRIGEFEGERRAVHDALYSRSDRGGASPARYVDVEYEVYATVELAEAWLAFETARAERDRLENADEVEFDAAAIDAAKRDGIHRLEDALASSPAPLTRHFLTEARELLSAGDSKLERRSYDDDEDWVWSQANSYARYLLGKGMIERIPNAVDLLTGTERDLG